MKTYELNKGREIPYNERVVILKFLEQFRDKDVIVADSYMTDTDVLSFDNEQVAFKSSEDYRKIVKFKRRIFFERKPYIVNLELLSLKQPTDDPRCLTIHGFDIITSDEKHSITLDTSHYFQKNILYSMVDIFDDKKIVSPESAYFKRIYTNTPLQGFINNHDWGKIIEGISQKPILANALFIMDEYDKNHECIEADFATILYQLITYRNNHENELTNGDLLELDRVIYELSKTELLKVHLLDSINHIYSMPTRSILLDKDKYSFQTHKSEQFNIDNGEVLEEKKTLNRVLRQFK